MSSSGQNIGNTNTAQGWGTTGAATATGALAGGAAGSFVPIVGTGIGAGVGAAAGYVGSGGLQRTWDTGKDLVQDVRGWFGGGGPQNAANALTGTLSPSQVNQYLSGVQQPNAVQIAGMPEYQNAMQSLSQNYGGAAQGANAALQPYGQQFGQVAQGYGNLGQQFGAQAQGIGQQQAGLYDQIPQGPNLQAATADPMAQQQALQRYQQSIAMGQAPSAADQMLQNQNARLGGQLQSGIVSAGGMNPALALRSLFQNQSTAGAQIGAQAAQQKLQEQSQFGQQAAQGAQALYGQNFNNAQTGFANQNTTYGNQMNNLGQQLQTAQTGFQGQGQALQGIQSAIAAGQQNTQMQFLNKMQSLSAQKDIAQGIFSSNAQQATYNQNYADNLQAYQRFIAGSQLQAAQDQSRGNAAAWQAGINALSQMGGAGLQYGMSQGQSGNGGISPAQASAANMSGSGSYNTATGAGGDTGNAAAFSPMGQQSNAQSAAFSNSGIGQ